MTALDIAAAAAITLSLAETAAGENAAAGFDPELQHAADSAAQLDHVHYHWSAHLIFAPPSAAAGAHQGHTPRAIPPHPLAAAVAARAPRSADASLSDAPSYSAVWPIGDFDCCPPIA